MSRRTTDADLLTASRQGDSAAFGEIVERYQATVCAITYSRTGNRSMSEDLAQDTFLAAWRQLDTLREANKLRGWLCGIAKNLARKARQRSDREAPLEGELVFTGASAFDAVSDAETERVVGGALERVPETYRDVLVLYYREQHSARDVAAALGLSEATVLQRLARGRKYLVDGLDHLVERSLRAQRTRRNLAVAVVAALPALVPSGVEASTPAWRAPSMKLVAAAAAAVAVAMTAATLAYVVHGASPSDETAGGVAPAPSATRAQSASAYRAAATPAAAALPATLAIPTAAPDFIPPEVANATIIDRETLDRLQLERGPTRGPATAPVTIVMFADGLCPFSGRSLGVLDQLFDTYPDKLRIVVKQFPVHAEARLAAEAVYAADAQGKFWEMHEQIFIHQDDLSRGALVEYASQIGLDRTAFVASLGNGTHAAAVDADLAAGREIEVQGTPAFLINGRLIAGAHSVEVLRWSIDSALAGGR